MTRNVDAIFRLFKVVHSNVGNLPSMPGIFPDYPTPVIHGNDDDREVAMMR